MATTRVGLVDDHPLFRSALAEVLTSDQGVGNIELIEAGSLDDMLARLENGLEIDLLMLDLGMPGLHGLLGLLSVRGAHPHIPVIVVSASSEPAVAERCMMLGASAFIPKSCSMAEIRKVVRVVLAGVQWVPDADQSCGSVSLAQRAELQRLCTLSAREVQVCRALCQGLLNKQIAHRLDISEATVKAHVSRILEKLAVSSRTQAVVLLQRLDGEMPGASPPHQTAG